MHTLKSILSGICLLCCLGLAAQRKNLVSDIPYSNKIQISEQVLESLFNSAGKISLDLSPDFHLAGYVQNKSNHGNSVTSLLVKVENGKGGMLSIIRYKDFNGHISYSGNFLKLHANEGLVLIEKDQHYYFIETQQKFLVSE